MNRSPAQMRAIRGNYAKKNQEKAPVAVTTEEVEKTVSYGTLAYQSAVPVEYLRAPEPEVANPVTQVWPSEYKPEPDPSPALPLVQRLLARGLQNMMGHEALEIAAWLLERERGR